MRNVFLVDLEDAGNRICLHGAHGRGMMCGRSRRKRQTSRKYGRDGNKVAPAGMSITASWQLRVAVTVSPKVGTYLPTYADWPVRYLRLSCLKVITYDVVPPAY